MGVHMRLRRNRSHTERVKADADVMLTQFARDAYVGDGVNEHSVYNEEQLILSWHADHPWKGSVSIHYGPIYLATDMYSGHRLTRPNIWIGSDQPWVLV